MSFVAIYNTPGYLPDSDSPPPVFDTAQEAWSYLADERTQHEDQVEPEAAVSGDPGYSETREKLAVLGTEVHWSGTGSVSGGDWQADSTTVEWLHEHGLTATGCGSVTGPTPGYVGDHDLGVSYEVQVTE